MPVLIEIINRMTDPQKSTQMQRERRERERDAVGGESDSEWPYAVILRHAISSNSDCGTCASVTPTCPNS